MLFPPTPPNTKIVLHCHLRSLHSTAPPTMKSFFLFSPRSRHHLHRTLHNLRVSLLCSLLTFIVLRSSLGAGKFGTPVQDYEGIRRHLHNFRLRHQSKLLTRRGLAVTDATLRKDASRSTLSLPTLPSEELQGASDGVNRAARSRPHTASSSAPHIMLVTGSALTKCENAVEAQFLFKLLKNKMDYCHLHDMEIFVEAEMDADSEVAKSRLLRKLLLSHPEVEWIWWLDSTIMLTNMSYELPYERFVGHNVVRHSLRDGESHGIGRSSLVRNCEWTLEYLTNADQGAQLSSEIPMDMEGHGLKVGLDNAWPFITDFKRCNLCGTGVDLTCLSLIERAYIFADGQHRRLGSL